MDHRQPPQLFGSQNLDPSYISDDIMRANIMRLQFEARKYKAYLEHYSRIYNNWNESYKCTRTSLLDTITKYRSKLATAQNQLLSLEEQHRELTRQYHKQHLAGNQ